MPGGIALAQKGVEIDVGVLHQPVDIQASACSLFSMASSNRPSSVKGITIHVLA